jgi:hypothetical protein
MNAAQFADSNALEPIYRKPDGRSHLNRLSKDLQAAVADYAARHVKLIDPAAPPDDPPQSTPPPVKWACERKSAGKRGKAREKIENK